jgi:hypothetical protein
MKCMMCHKEIKADNNSLAEKITEIKAAYKELWAAVENGTVKEHFFELREKFRRLI